MQAEDLKLRIDQAEETLNPAALLSQLEELEEQTLHPGFWESQGDAQRTMELISNFKEEMGRLEKWKKTLDDIHVALELSQEEVGTTVVQTNHHCITSALYIFDNV